jgi:hypothetical protein
MKLCVHPSSGCVFSPIPGRAGMLCIQELIERNEIPHGHWHVKVNGLCVLGMEITNYKAKDGC